MATALDSTGLPKQRFVCAKTEEEDAITYPVPIQKFTFSGTAGSGFYLAFSSCWSNVKKDGGFEPTVCSPFTPFSHYAYGVQVDVLGWVFTRGSIGSLRNKVYCCTIRAVCQKI